MSLSLKIYLAGSFHRGDELRGIANRLHNLGAEVTSRWLNGSHEVDVQEKGSEALAPGTSAQRFAEEDLEDIRRADMVLFFSPTPEQPSNGRGGRHTEYGYALALGKVIYIIGKRECVFHALSESFATFDDWVTFWYTSLEVGDYQ